MAYCKKLPPLRSETLDVLKKRIAKGEVLSYEEVLDYEKIIRAELEISKEEAKKTDDTSDWDRFLNTHSMCVGDCLSCVMMTNVPSYCRENPYDWEPELKDAMNAALLENFYKEDGTSSKEDGTSSLKEDDFVKSVIVDSPVTLFVMKTQEYARAAKRLESILFKEVKLNVRTDPHPVWDYSTDDYSTDEDDD